MTYPRRRPASRRSLLESPWLSVALVVVVLLLGGALVVPGLLSRTPGPTAATPQATSAPTSTATLPAPTFVRPTPSPQPTFTTYVVRSRDTLNSIAKAFGTTARSIAWWNRGTYPSLDPESEAYRPNYLEVGWRLVLLPNAFVDDTNPPTPSPGPPTPPVPASQPGG